MQESAPLQGELENLRREIHFHNYRYHVLDAPLVSDAEYDRLMERLKAKLLALDELWGRADQSTTAEEKVRLQQEAQQIMGEIIQLGRADRNQRLTGIAKQLGLENGADISRFIEDVDRALAETHLDWVPLFNRGAETPTEETVR